LAQLSGMLVVVAAAASPEEQNASTGANIQIDVATSTGGDSGDDDNDNNVGGECPSCDCDCIMADFENLQNNLDSCLATHRELDNTIQKHKDEVATLSSTYEVKSKEEQQKWDQEKKELHILINDLQRTIDTKTENEAKLKNVQADFEKQIKLLESEIQFMKKSHQENTLTIKNEVDDARTAADECQSRLTDISTKHEEAFEKLDSMERKQSNLSDKYNKRIKEIRSQIATMNKELEQKNNAFRSMQDMYHDAREDVTNLDRELRMMHIRAQNTYFNSTLVVEDTMKYLYRTMDKSVLVAEDLMNHPRVMAAYKTAQSKLTPITEKIIPIYKENVLPELIAIGNKMKEIDAIEGVRLTLISIIEQGSTIGLNYIELTMDKRVGPRRFQSKASRVLKYSKKNSEYIVHTTFQLFVAYLGYKFLFFVFKILIFLVLKAVKLCTVKKVKSV